MPFAFTRRTDKPLEVRIYHICHFDNLASIAGGGELCPSNLLHERGVAPRSIAYSHLQHRRDSLQVPIPPNGDLHDYVPWSFAARSPMLYTIARGALGNATSQNDILHFISDVAQVRNLDLPFVFTDGHPLTTQFTRFSSELSELVSFLDWPVLLDPWWQNSSDDRDRKRRRQAEFLVHGSVPWAIVRGIGVKTEAMSHKVAHIV